MLSLLPTSKYVAVFRLSIIDVAWLVISPFLALTLRGIDYLDLSRPPYLLLIPLNFAIVSILCTLPFFLIFRINDGLSHMFSSRDLLMVLAASVCGVILSVFAVFSISRLDGIPRPVPINFGLILIFGLLLHRLLIRAYYERQSSNMINATTSISYAKEKRIVVVGVDPFSINTVHLLRSQQPRTIQVVALFSADDTRHIRKISNINIFNNINELANIIEEYKIHGITINEVWVSDYSGRYCINVYHYVRDVCLRKGIKYKKISEALNLNIIFNEIKTSPFGDNFKISKNKFYTIKRISDLVAATLLIIACAPIFIISANLALLFMGAPVIFWQERIGQYGNIIRIYKIRTLAAPIVKNGLIYRDSTTLSKFSYWVRRLRFDEIPQLINILVGEMSLIGPRPLLLSDQPINNTVRLLLRPGITGWSQVNGGELLNSEEKNALDCWYVFNMSIKVDLLIVCKTIKVLFMGVRRNEENIRKARYWAIENHKI